MPEIRFEKTQAFPYGFENIPFRGILFNLPKIGVGLGCENELVHRCYLACLAKDPRLTDPF